MGMLRCWKQAWPFTSEARSVPGLEGLEEAGEAWLPHRQGVCVYLFGSCIVSQVVIDPLELGGATRRRRIYILMVHEDVRLKALRLHSSFEKQLNQTYKKLKKPEWRLPNPRLGCNDATQPRS